MEQEKFTQVKSNINRIIDSINQATLYGRKTVVSKYSPRDSHIKKEINIPKIKGYNDNIDYSISQVLYDYTNEWGNPLNKEKVILDMSLCINCRDDIYNAKFKITHNEERTYMYSDIETREKILLDENTQTENLIDFIDNLIRIFDKISDVEAFSHKPLISTDTILDELNMSYRNINEILNS